MRLSRRFTLNGKKAPPGTLYLFDGGAVSGIDWVYYQTPYHESRRASGIVTGGRIDLRSKGITHHDHRSSVLDYQSPGIRSEAELVIDLTDYRTFHFFQESGNGDRSLKINGNVVLNNINGGENEVDIRGVIREFIDADRMALEWMGDAPADLGLFLGLVQPGEQKDQEGSVIAQGELAASSVLLLKPPAKPAVIGAVPVVLLEFQFLLVDNDISEHNDQDFLDAAAVRGTVPSGVPDGRQQTAAFVILTVFRELPAAFRAGHHDVPLAAGDADLLPAGRTAASAFEKGFPMGNSISRAVEERPRRRSRCRRENCKIHQRGRIFVNGHFPSFKHPRKLYPESILYVLNYK